MALGSGSVPKQGPSLGKSVNSAGIRNDQMISIAYMACLYLSDSGAMQHLLHISEISNVMGILRLFSDECECRECAGTERGELYELKVYSGARTYKSPIEPAYSC